MSSNALRIDLQSDHIQESRAQALRALLQPNFMLKCQWVEQVMTLQTLDCDVIYSPDGILPGRPESPRLVNPTQVKTRGVHTVPARAALLHAIAHIEFNAINLALDVVWRFPGLPPEFYRDWLRVASEEASHFGMLREHLQSLGYDYGDFPAHDGLWEMAVKTSDDLLDRLALVPRTLEARGLDASPAIRDKLFQAGDAQGAEILDVILQEEIDHVRIGNHWYRWLCEQRGLDSLQMGALLEEKHAAPKLRGPFNLVARRAAGFDEAELARLMQQMPV